MQESEAVMGAPGARGDRMSIGESFTTADAAASNREDGLASADSLVVMSVCIQKHAIGIATYVSEVSEISILDCLQAESTEDELLPMYLALSLHCPNVVLVAENVDAETREKIARAAGDACEIVLAKPWWFRLATAEKNLEELWVSGMPQDLSSADRKGYILGLLPVAASDEVLGSLGALLSCIFAQKLLGTVEVESGEKLHMLQSFSQFNLKEHVQVDLPTLAALQIFSSENHPSNFVSNAKEGLSLYALLDHCGTAQGKRMLKYWLLNPITNVREIELRQGEVDYLLSLPTDVLNSIQDNLCSMKGMSSTLKQVLHRQGCGRTSRAHLILLHRYLLSGTELMHTCSKILQWKAPPVVVPGMEGFASLDGQCAFEVLAAMARTLDIRSEDPSPEDDFLVAPGVSGTLDEYKAVYGQLHGILNGVLGEELRRVPSELVRRHEDAEWDLVHLPQFGFVIRTRALLPADLREVLRDFRFVSDFCKEFFLYKSDSTARLDQEFGDLHTKIQDLETAILSQFTFEILQVPLWQELVERSARLDVLLSLASVARAYDLRRPRMVSDNVLEILNGRHILNEQTVQDGSFIPNNTVFPEDTGRVHVVTGPNFSGKTVYAKQVALIVYMAHLGSFVPAEEARIGICDKILTRLDSIDASSMGQSSFMVDLSQVLNTLRNATSRSLVLLDEFGRGTGSSDGFGLFFSVLSAFARRPYPPRVIACTHFSCAAFLDQLVQQERPGTCQLSFQRMECFIERKDAASRAGGAELEVESSDSKVIYLYRLKNGISNDSLGVFCARLAGLSEPIWQRAHQILTLRADPEGVVEAVEGESSGRSADSLDDERLGRFLRLDLSNTADFEPVRRFLGMAA